MTQTNKKTKKDQISTEKSLLLHVLLQKIPEKNVTIIIKSSFNKVIMMYNIKSEYKQKH